MKGDTSTREWRATQQRKKQRKSNAGALGRARCAGSTFGVAAAQWGLVCAMMRSCVAPSPLFHLASSSFEWLSLPALRAHHCALLRDSLPCSLCGCRCCLPPVPAPSLADPHPHHLHCPGPVSAPTCNDERRHALVRLRGLATRLRTLLPSGCSSAAATVALPRCPALTRSYYNHERSDH